ncbi:MAG: hypothetical protein E7433_06360 [Ruminococcaceae bacterium]|nr:hypothetical protein [Oscillospiraceae bacterium]
MNCINCNFKCSCTAIAWIVSAIIGVIAAFLQITAVITVAPVFLWVALGIAVVYLGILVGATVLARRPEESCCKCRTLGTLLVGLLGTIALAVILLAVGIVATSVISAILVGLLVFFLALTFAGSACFVKCAAGCEI